MDIDAGAIWDFAGEIVGTIRPKQPAQRATVTRIDSEGTVWVKTPDGAEAPAAECGADVRPGDEVTLGFDGARMSVDANVSNPPAASSVVDRVREIAGTAKDIASAVGQHFWFDGNGAHVSTESGNPEGRQNTIWNSLGMLFRRGQNIVLAIVTGTDPGIEIYDGTGNDAENMTASFKADETHLGMSGAGAVYMANDQFVVSSTYTNSGTTYHTEAVDGQIEIVEDSTVVDSKEMTKYGFVKVKTYEHDDSSGGSTSKSLSTKIALTAALGDGFDGLDFIQDGVQASIFATSRVEYDPDMEDPSEQYSQSSVVEVVSDELMFNELNIGDPREDGRYGTDDQSSNLALDANTGKAVCSHAFAPGTYLVTGHVSFAANASGHRAINLLTTAGSLPNAYAAMTQWVPAVSGHRTHLSVMLLWSPATTQTLYLNALSSVALTCQGQMRWVKLL